MAFEPKRILLASDFKGPSDAAETDAVLLARTFDAEVKVVHVQPFSWESSPGLTGLGTASLRACAQRLRESKVRVQDPELLHGSPAETFIRAAETAAMDVIVIGATARSSVVGATAETVARFARQPVWIARARTNGRIERILCGVDGSLASEHAARDASLLARALSAELVFVHVVDTSDLDGLASTHAEELERIRRSKQSEVAGIERFLDALGSPSGVSTRRFLGGKPADVVRRMAHEESFDLVVMGRVGAGGLRRVLLGSTAERLLRKLPCGFLLTSPAPFGGA
jgi:nucleotide-binding universal stress UspA family protein